MGRRKIGAIDPLEGREMMSITPILGLLENPPVIASACRRDGGRLGECDRLDDLLRFEWHGFGVRL